MLAETNKYFWLPIPPAHEYRTSKAFNTRWNKQDLLRASKSVGSEWVVIVQGGRGDPREKIQRYGAFITSLMDGTGGIEQIKRVFFAGDGVVYKIHNSNG